MASVGRRKVLNIKSVKRTERMYGVVICCLTPVFDIKEMMGIKLKRIPKTENTIATLAMKLIVSQHHLATATCGRLFPTGQFV